MSGCHYSLITAAAGSDDAPRAVCHHTEPLSTRSSSVDVDCWRTGLGQLGHSRRGCNVERKLNKLLKPQARKRSTATKISAALLQQLLICIYGRLGMSAPLEQKSPAAQLLAGPKFPFNFGALPSCRKQDAGVSKASESHVSSSVPPRSWQALPLLQPPVTSLRLAHSRKAAYAISTTT